MTVLLRILGHPGGSWYTANRDHALALATKNWGGACSARRRQAGHTPPVDSRDSREEIMNNQGKPRKTNEKS